MMDLDSLTVIAFDIMSTHRNKSYGDIKNFEKWSKTNRFHSKRTSQTTFQKPERNLENIRTYFCTDQPVIVFIKLAEKEV